MKPFLIIFEYNLIHMKAKLISITTYVFVILLLTHCTIEKRVFQKGYHIEWKKKNASESARNEPEKFSTASTNSVSHSDKQAQEEVVRNHIQEKDSVIFNKQASGEKPVSTITNATSEPVVSYSKTNASDPVTIITESSTEQAETTPPDQKDDDLRLETEKKVFEPVGFVSFGFYFLAIILGLFAIPALNALPFLVFSGLLFILSLVLGIISVVRYRRNKERYRRNFFGYFGLIASMITITLGGLFVLVAFLAGSF